MDMNKLQRIASNITGYSGAGSDWGASDGYYYDHCNNTESKIQQVKAQAACVDECISDDDAVRIMMFIEADHEGSEDARHKAFLKLI